MKMGEYSLFTDGSHTERRPNPAGVTGTDGDAAIRMPASQCRQGPGSQRQRQPAAAMARLPLLAAALGLLALIPTHAAPDLANWQGRSVYFVVTDRFARDADANSSAPSSAGTAAGLELCGNGTKEWCGGTLKGNHLLSPG